MQNTLDTIHQKVIQLFSLAGYRIKHAETVKYYLPDQKDKILRNHNIKPCEYITYLINNQNCLLRYDNINGIITTGPHIDLNMAYLFAVDPINDIIYIFTPSAVIYFTTYGQPLGVWCKPEMFKIYEFAVIKAEIINKTLEFFDISAGLLKIPVFSINF